MTKKQRDKITTAIYKESVKLGLYAPKIRRDGFCRVGETWRDCVECGEVYSDYWLVTIFNDGTFQIGWLKLDNVVGTCLVTEKVNNIEDVYSFLAKQR